MNSKSDEIIRLISEAKLLGSYSYIILDLDFGIDSDTIKILKQANALVWTGDGSEISNIKISRAYDALAISEQNEDVPILNRIVLIYNKFSNKSSRALASNIELKI